MKRKKLISFIISTRRFDFLTKWFDRMENTVSDPNCMEVLIKFDSDQPGVKEYIESERAKRPFDIKYLITPRIEALFSLWIGVEQLFFMTDPNSYFIQVLSDEPYFVTPHWDEVLRRYIGFFPDHIFRLRVSSMKFANYTSHYECTFRPDSFAIYTRKWLQLTLGMGNCWGTDAFQQCITFQLSLGPRSYKNIFRVNAQWRDIVPHDLEMAGLEFCVGVDSAMREYRHRLTLREWKRLTSYPMQKHFSYLASRLYCGIWAHEQGVNEYYIKEDSLKSMTQLYDKQHNLLLEVSHDVPVLPVLFQKLYINIYFLKRLPISLFDRKVKSQSAINKNKIQKTVSKRPIDIINKYYQALTNIMIRPFFRKKPPPGIKVLYDKRTKLPPRVKPPKKEEIQWAKKILHELDANKKTLETSLISEED